MLLSLDKQLVIFRLHITDCHPGTQTRRHHSPSIGESRVHLWLSSLLCFVFLKSWVDRGLGIKDSFKLLGYCCCREGLLVISRRSHPGSSWHSLKASSRTRYLWQDIWSLHALCLGMWYLPCLSTSEVAVVQRPSSKSKFNWYPRTQSTKSQYELKAAWKIDFFKKQGLALLVEILCVHLNRRLVDSQQPLSQREQVTTLCQQEWFCDL